MLPRKSPRPGWVASSSLLSLTSSATSSLWSSKSPQKETPTWLSWSREQLGETPRFLIGTGTHRSRCAYFTIYIYVCMRGLDSFNYSILFYFIYVVDVMRKSTRPPLLHLANQNKNHFERNRPAHQHDLSNLPKTCSIRPSSLQKTGQKITSKQLVVPDQ